MAKVNQGDNYSLQLTVIFFLITAKHLQVSKHLDIDQVEMKC